MEKFIKEIESYAAAVGRSPSTVSFHAVNDGKFYARLKASKRGPSIGVVQKFRDYMKANPPKSDAA